MWASRIKERIYQYLLIIYPTLNLWINESHRYIYGWLSVWSWPLISPVWFSPKLWLPPMLFLMLLCPIRPRFFSQQGICSHREQMKTLHHCISDAVYCGAVSMAILYNDYWVHLWPSFNSDTQSRVSYNLGDASPPIVIVLPCLDESELLRLRSIQSVKSAGNTHCVHCHYVLSQTAAILSTQPADCI